MTRPAAAATPVLDARADLAIAPGTHLLDGALAVREPQWDTADGEQAWRLVIPCTAARCFHPIHGFGKPHGRAHLTWLRPGETQPAPLRSQPVR
ncbi:hypothetical protein [Cellulosimicrobium sp. Marseille-Q4280]|uniref:hypothetical protein n=1 Tax=Cellulosimicrobium sp. Marseille-Q4280 TaxID=2937992 RepID=UPI00203C3222|nr:hypothetical protein [Cellulosimicrobium sp. Marseille-Q4280]